MKKIYVCLLGFALFLGIGQVSAQQLQVIDDIQFKKETKNFTPGNRSDSFRGAAALCSADSIQYSISKATALRGVNVNNATSASEVGQYYDAPQPITISGVRFYGYKIDATGGTTSTVTVSVYRAAPDSLPTGAALASGTITLDTNRYGGSLGPMAKVVMFNSPITVTSNYIVVVANPSPNGVGVLCTDYTAAPPDGVLEWLADAKIGPNWRRGYQITLGPSTPLDADFLIEPIVSFNLFANFRANPPCVTAPGSVAFTNTSSPVLRNRMYNAAVSIGLGGVSVTWDFGDGNVQQQVTTFDTTHMYAASGNYIVSLYDTLYGWTRDCAADTSITLSGPTVVFSSSGTGLTISFSDQTGMTGATYAWDFGDGGTSTSQNPSHTYAASGTYNVCLTITSVCGTHTGCQSVTTGGVGLQNSLTGGSFSLFPNPAANMLKVSLSLAGTQTASLNVYNSIGTLVKTAELGQVQSSTLELPISDLAAGSYFVQLVTENGFASKRLNIVR